MTEPNFKKIKQGFTVVELMVTIAVLTILLTVVVPSYSALIESSKQRTTRDLLVSSIYTAIQQAQTKSVNAYLCPTTTGTSCATEWKDGWLLYEDEDGNATLNDDESIVANVSSKTEQIVSTNVQIRFSPTGHSSSNTFTVCSNTDNTIIYEIVLSLMGRITFDEDNVGDSCP